MLRFSALARIIMDFGLTPELDTASLMARFVEHSVTLDFYEWVVREGHLTVVELARVEREFARTPFTCRQCGAIREGCELRGDRRLRCPVCNGTDLRFQDDLSDEPDRLGAAISSGEWEVGSIARAPRFGDWVGVHVVGKGSCGTVYQAINPGTGEVAAVKTLDVEYDRVVQGFFHEATICTTIRHPNIVHVREFGEVEGEPYLVMDWIDGMTLEDHVTHRGPFPLADVVAIGGQVASALDAVHRAGLVHRDVKPANIMIVGPAQACLMDFGIAKDYARKVTPHDIVMGTLQFMAPEQCASTAEVTAASDVFSLGITLYYAITAHELRRSLEPGETPHAESLPSVKDHCAAAPTELDELLQTMCRHEPTERPTANAVADALQAIGEGLNEGLNEPP